ncbi:11386_t:CDS:2 [Ambispora gerdemannii]|uniref:11386_t:CDS:1 n=1 Tax=Ambispora gerdemannii TaxID=144530 RepID=A0A9N8W0F2_9GLOM|nr:11386_t:CDS:2 [Ambispora gerdemannii]
MQKFIALLTTVTCTEELDAFNAFVKKVHINALHRNINAKQSIRIGISSHTPISLPPFFVHPTIKVSFRILSHKYSAKSFVRVSVNNFANTEANAAKDPESIDKGPKSNPGEGHIICELSKCSVKPVFSTYRASYPLKFISPRTHSPHLAAVYLLTYGGGLVSGDVISVKIECLEGVNLMLLTQGSTKVYKKRNLGQQKHPRNYSVAVKEDLNAPPISPKTVIPSSSSSTSTTQQKINARIHKNSLLLQLPEPTTCFRDSVFTQRQTFALEDETASIVCLDWFTSGRMSRGEKWEFLRYESGVDILVEEELVFRDVVSLVQRHQNNTTVFSFDEITHNLIKDRLEPYQCYATCVIYGPRVRSLMRHVLEEFDSIVVNKSTRLPELIWSASVLSSNSDNRNRGDRNHSNQSNDDSNRSESEDSNRSESEDNLRGLVVKVAGTATEMVRNFLCTVVLKGLDGIVGDDLFTQFRS